MLVVGTTHAMPRLGQWAAPSWCPAAPCTQHVAVVT